MADFIKSLFGMALVGGVLWLGTIFWMMHVDNTHMAKHAAVNETRERAEFAVYCANRKTADELDHFLFSDRDCAHPDAPPRSHGAAN